MDDLDVLEPAAVEVAYRGERLQVRPLTIGSIPRFLREARPAIDALVDATWLGPDATDSDFLDGGLSLIETHAESVCRAIAVCINRDVEWISGGNVAEFYALAMKVLEVNRDFFTRQTGQLLAARALLRPGAGQTPSSF